MIKKVCDVCGRETDDYIMTVDGDVVCNDCYNHDGVKRCSCGVTILATKDRCNDCEERLYKIDMNPYSTKPIPMFKNHYTNLRTAIPKQRYYGMELEYNNVDARKVHTLGYALYKEKLIYNKSDSSIYNGVEVVTSPLDRKSIKELFDRFGEVFEYIKTKEYDTNAGVHIHISKDSISVPDRYKLCLLLNNADVSGLERKAMYYLAGRVKNLDLDIDDHYFRIGTHSGWKCTSMGHDKALNTSNDNTYEFRIFKASADKDILMSYVELTDKMIDFCNTHGLKDVTISKFIQWLKVNTRNKIILEKIQKFEDKFGTIPIIERIIPQDKLIMLFRGIHWSDYPKVVASLQCNTSVRKAVRDYEIYSEASKVIGTKNKTLQEKLLNTYRKVAMNYILKNQDREELKCASQ